MSKANAIKDGTEQVRELNAKKLRELAGRDLAAAKYPLYVFFDNPRFQMPNLKGLDAISNEAVKELSVAACRLVALEGIDCFVKLKRLWAGKNAIKRCSINFASLDLLDLSKNALFEIPDLSGCPNLKELDVSGNKIRGVWSGLISSSRLQKLNLSKNKVKWDRDLWGAAMGIAQGLTSLKELTLQGNKVTKAEGYRYYMANYLVNLKILDDVETSGDAHQVNNSTV